MSLTVVTSKQVIETSQNASIVIVSMKSAFQQALDRRIPKISRWSDCKTETSIDSLIEEEVATELSTTESASNALIITISPKVPYGIFLNEELTKSFEKVYTDYVRFGSELSDPKIAIEELAGICFDNINPKLTISTGPIILDAVLKYLWLTPLGETRTCYILAREEFVACFLSWLGNQAFVGGSQHNSSENSRERRKHNLEGIFDSLTFRRPRVRMPIGRKCVSDPRMSRELGNC